MRPQAQHIHRYNASGWCTAHPQVCSTSGWCTAHPQVCSTSGWCTAHPQVYSTSAGVQHIRLVCNTSAICTHLRCELHVVLNYRCRRTSCALHRKSFNFAGTILSSLYVFPHVTLTGSVGENFMRIHAAAICMRKGFSGCNPGCNVI